MLARLSTLMRLILVTAPELYRPFARASSTHRRSSEEKSIERLYASVDDADFSHDVLGTHPISLAVLPVRACERSELGEPTRIIRLIRRSGISPVLACCLGRFAPRGTDENQVAGQDTMKTTRSVIKARGRFDWRSDQAKRAAQTID